MRSSTNLYSTFSFCFSLHPFVHDPARKLCKSSQLTSKSICKKYSSYTTTNHGFFKHVFIKHFSLKHVSLANLPEHLFPEHIFLEYLYLEQLSSRRLFLKLLSLKRLFLERIFLKRLFYNDYLNPCSEQNYYLQG